MNANTVHAVVTDFLDLIEDGKGSIEFNEQVLLQVLDRLAMAYHYAKDQCDEEFDLIPPTKDYQQIRDLVSERFPDFGYYNLPKEVASHIPATEVVVADAIDDITDIARDMWEIAWRWSHTSECDALWHFRFGYHSHWGSHLRGLQLYLYARNSEQ